jgi:hypothetical protein
LRFEKQADFYKPIRLTRWQTASSDCGEGRSLLRSRLVTNAERFPVGTDLRNRRPTSSGMANVIFMQAIWLEWIETQLKNCAPFSNPAR